MDLFEYTISFILIGFFLSNVYITTLLYRYARDGEWKFPALNERFYSAAIKTGGNFLLALLGMNRILELHWDVVLVLVMLSIAVIMHSLPPYIWYFYLKTGRFNRKSGI